MSVRSTDLSDLIQQLRFHFETTNGDAHATAGEAADAIERLLGEVARLEAELAVARSGGRL